MSSGENDIAILHSAEFENITQIQRCLEEEGYSVLPVSYLMGGKTRGKKKGKRDFQTSRNRVIIIDEKLAMTIIDFQDYYEMNETLVLLVNPNVLPADFNVNKDDITVIKDFSISEIVPCIVEYTDEQNSESEIGGSDVSVNEENTTTTPQAEHYNQPTVKKICATTSASPSREQISSASDKTTKSGVNLFFYILFPILASGVIYIAWLTDREIVKEENLSIVERFENRIEELKSIHHQEPKLWKIVKSSMKRHIIDSDPQQPAVLMVVSSKKAATEREVLAKQLAKVYSLRCNKSNHIAVLGADYQDLRHAASKEKLDIKISTGFNTGACAAVISNFEKLPPASTTVFYQFCENDLAPFTRVAVIFTLEISYGPWDTDNQFSMLKQGNTPSPKFWDRIVDAFLYHSLQQRDGSGIMKVDMISGLLTRITPSVIWVE